MNNFLQYYGQHGVSPVAQKTGGLFAHRRASLYRQLGLPAQAFRSARVLEVGPGNGDNALATAGFRPAEYILIEPNPPGFSALAEQPFPPGSVTLCHCRLEDYADTSGFDIVLCEGLIPGLDNRREFLTHLIRHVRPGGLLVITCYDAVSMFFETLRRAITIELVAGMEDFETKVSVLTDAFRPHLATLVGMTRSIEDWVIDNLLAPPVFNVRDWFSLAEAIEELGKEFFFIQSSPSFLANYTWYKELPENPEDYNRPYLEDFATLRHNLMHYRHLAPPRPPEANTALAEACATVARTVAARDSLAVGDYHLALKAGLETVRRSITGDSFLENAVEAGSALALDGSPNPRRVAEADPAFATAFGRGQQYASFQKIVRD